MLHHLSRPLTQKLWRIKKKHIEESFNMLFDTMGGVSMVLCIFNEGWLYQPKSCTGRVKNHFTRVTVPM
jgi:hypothetical protein